MENNYDILQVPEGAAPREIQAAFRRLALLHHSDRGGDMEQFKRIKRAYEDLKQGKKYPDSEKERLRNSRVYSGDDEAETRRRNAILAAEISGEMRLAGDWAAALARSGASGTRLFGSKTLGEMEFSVGGPARPPGALAIKGNVMAGSLVHDGPILMQGSVNSPSFAPEHATSLTLTRGDFKLVSPTKNRYRVENGASITAENGDIVVGNVTGSKSRVQDPDGKVGLYVTVERRTRLLSPRGSIVAGDVADTVSMDARTVIAVNMENDVRVAAKEIMVYGSKMTYDVSFELKRGGQIRFFTKGSVLGLSDDATISLENGKSFYLHTLKTRKIRDLPGAGPRPGGPGRGSGGRGDTMVGGGFSITYAMLDRLGGDGGAAAKGAGGRSWRSRLGLGR